MEKNGEVIERSRGTPQGGVVSPILSNLFLHYAFDLWMTRTHPDLPWCRYADDGLVHCQSEQQAEALKVELSSRLAACGLQMHPTKTKIVRVYAKSARGHDIEVGGIWKKENQDGKPYYTLSIRKLRYNANLGRFPGQDDASLQAIIEWVPRD
ncbi:hypothetical protein GOL30_31890 [Sinorhizobium medicae]|nr:hypothetical protein [Sinorhizobium medicae]MDX0624254.1 hypothetical protein [Sinorhizobium medicae]MDX0723253.1 hypothetical protein [Sinorhizobium medicae]MDX0992231.1 hypothetical protein [Sinorhizobium medicae]MDX1079169.1 hypothetical protein [Sinorhizobium medicae]